MHKVVFKNYRGNLMKFVNKLSVISLIVLMFSFMNVVNAANLCKHSQTRSCDDVNKLPYSNDEKAKWCNGYFEASSETNAHQCEWAEVPAPLSNNKFVRWSCIANKEKCTATTYDPRY